MDERTLSDIVLTLITTIMASSGFWALFEYRWRRRDTLAKERNLQVDLLRGLAHDRIMFLGMKYIIRGELTADEYENLFCYLYQPYKAMDGNGSADRIIAEVNKLPVKAVLSKKQEIKEYNENV